MGSRASVCCERFAGGGRHSNSSSSYNSYKKLTNRSAGGLHGEEHSGAKTLTVSATDANGSCAYFSGLHPNDEFREFKKRVAKAFHIPFGLTIIGCRDKVYSVPHHQMTLLDLGFEDGMWVQCHCKPPGEFNGFLYALTETRVPEDGTIHDAIREEFGSEAVIADFSSLERRCVDMTRSEFNQSLDTLGSFVTAQVIPSKRLGNRPCYCQREMEDSMFTGRYANIHQSLSLRSGGFHPMYVLVELNQWTEIETIARIRALGELSRASLSAMRNSNSSLSLRSLGI